MRTLTRFKNIFRSRLFWAIFALLVIVAGGIFAGLRWFTNDTSTRRVFSLVFPRRDTLVATINATGQIEPDNVVELMFAGSGRVSEVLVQVGDAVLAGAALARLDTRELELRVDQAAATLAQAQASYDKLRGGATPEELTAAEAQVRQVSGQLRQVQGSVTSADIRAAQGQLQQAQAQLSKLLAGPKAADLQLAEAQLRQAEAQLVAQRNQLSAAKTNAKLQLDQAVNSLTQAQARYATALQNWQYVQETGSDPSGAKQVDPQTGAMEPRRLSDAEQRQYYEAAVQAEAALRSAESAVQQAELAYNNARQTEVTGVQIAEQQLAAAQATLDKLLAGVDADQLAAARAAVASATAQLTKLQGEQRRGSLQAAEAAVAQAQSNIERLQAGPHASDIAVALAQVQNAQAALELAELALSEATLTAPFAGTVAAMNLRVGEVPSPAVPSVVLADLSRFHVDVSVDEIDVSQLAEGQPVTVTLDALPDLALSGTLETISPLSTAGSAVTSYEVRVVITARDPRVRSGMSAAADIVVARKSGALVVPRRAVRSDRGRRVVDFVDAALCHLPPDQIPSNFQQTQQPVRSGLSNEYVIEVLEGLDERMCVYVEGIDARMDPFRGPPRR